MSSNCIRLVWITCAFSWPLWKNTKGHYLVNYIIFACSTCTFDAIVIIDMLIHSTRSKIQIDCSQFGVLTVVNLDFASWFYIWFSLKWVMHCFVFLNNQITVGSQGRNTQPGARQTCGESEKKILGLSHNAQCFYFVLGQLHIKHNAIEMIMINLAICLHTFLLHDI